MNLYSVLSEALLSQRLRDGYVRAQDHPQLPLRILNYTEKAAYEGAWDDVTRVCRGLIYDVETLEVVARPFPKFFNHGEPAAPELDLDAPAVVTDKLDGSLGILYPLDDADLGGVYLKRWAVATRGSFTSDQALHASLVWKSRYEGRWLPVADCTHLFEIVYPENRIVCDYGGLDDLVYLETLETASGWPMRHETGYDWPGPRAERHPYATLAEALAAEPRPNREGLVVYLPATDERVKIKQDDYVALHRILTGTNARNVWEVAAVRACALYVTDRKQWGSFLRIDPARAEEVLALGDDWLDGVPDEFHAWIRETTGEAAYATQLAVSRAEALVEEVRGIDGRRERYEHVAAAGHPAAKEILRLADGREEEYGRLVMRCWLGACPEPTAPFARGEAVA